MNAQSPSVPLTTTLTPLNNLRDLGGIPVAGGVIRPGHLFRGDDVSTVPPTQAQELFDRGIRTIIDLRSPEEARATGRGPLGDHEIEYHSLPLLRGGAHPDEFLRHLQEGSATARTVGQYYASTLTAEASTIAGGIRTIVEAPGGTLFHCAAGKDRTGIFTAALLKALGAEDEDIATDYARSSQAVPLIMARVSASIGHLMGESDAYFQAAARGIGPVSPLLGAEHDAMLEMLRILEARHGGAMAVLQAGGVEESLVTRLRDRVVEGAAD